MQKSLKNWNPSYFFIFAALFAELMLTIATPPLESPDEFNHFCRAYQISEGNFFPVKQDQRLGGYIPQGIVKFCDQYRYTVCVPNYVTSYQEILSSFKIKADDRNRSFQDFANTAYYSPVPYLPHAFAMFVLRQLHASPAVLYYGGRFFVFLIWLICMYAVIKLLPAFKWLFTLLILLPMNTYLVNSFTADTVTNIISFLFIALVLKHIFITKMIRGRHILVLGLLLILLVLSKVVYIGIALLLLAIPKQKFNKPYQHLISLALLFLFSFAFTAVWSNMIMRLYIPIKDYNPLHLSRATVSPCGDFYAQKNYILSNGFYFLKVIYHSLFDHPLGYLTGYIGAFGNHAIRMPLWSYLVSFSIIMIVAIKEKNEFQFSATQKLIVLSAAGLCFVLLLLSQHLMWDCVGSGTVGFLQGRYLIPIFPLVLITFGGSFLKLKINAPLLVVPLVIVLALSCFNTIFQRFFIGRSFEKKEVYCNVEETCFDGTLKTSDPGVCLEGAGNRTIEQRHSGKYSALLSQASPYCFTYKFYGLKIGDLIEMEAWEKGEGTLLVISGKRKNCGEFYFAHSLKQETDKSGWHKIKNLSVYNMNCDSAEIGCYAWNPLNTNSFIDDVRICIKHFKNKEPAEHLISHDSK